MSVCKLAHIFGNLLRNAYDPVKGEVKDILAEVRSLRSELVKGEQQSQTINISVFRVFFWMIIKTIIERFWREYLGMPINQ